MKNGTRTDIRWWKQTGISGKGLEIKAAAPFSMSALHYSVEALDEGLVKSQRHSTELQKADFTELCIDLAQMGVGCVNTWGAIPLPQYQVPCKDYELVFSLSPVRK